VEIITRKNKLILELELAKKKKPSRREILMLASSAANLETQIAEQYLEKEWDAQAAISFLSAASCMKDARRFEEAKRLLDRALAYADTKELVEFIVNERNSIQVSRKPAEIFKGEVNILNNPSLRIPQREAYIAAKRHFSHSDEGCVLK
jgi:hypothetical protein